MWTFSARLSFSRLFSLMPFVAQVSCAFKQNCWTICSLPRCDFPFWYKSVVPLMSKPESRKPPWIAYFCKDGGAMGFGLFSVVFGAFFVLVWFLFHHGFWCRSESWCWGWQLPRCFKVRTPIAAPGLNGREAWCEWRSRESRRLPLCGEDGQLLMEATASKGKNFHFLLFWVQCDSLAKDLVVSSQTCDLSKPLGVDFRAFVSSLLFASLCPTSKLNSLWKPMGW